MMMRICARKAEISDKRIWMTMLIAVLLLLYASTSALALKKRDLRRSNSGGRVNIDVVYLNPLKQSQNPDTNLVFELRMNTHSVNLDAYRIEDLAVLRNDLGEQVRPMEFANPGGGGHHRSGMLKFPAQTPEGNRLIREDIKRIEVVIKNVAGVPERVFIWNLPIE
ncbi:MAG: hypothetical protein JRG73_19240 [Deltaproteobacteria bacterium]|nr:hypothetical protein [Deltaproteobacteria bacterium]